MDGDGNVSKDAIKEWYGNNNFGGRLDKVSGTTDSSQSIDFWYNSLIELQSMTDDLGDIDNYRQYENWGAKHAINISHLAAGDIDEDTYFAAEDKIGYEFDFMQGMDYNNEEDYDRQTLNLGKGEVASKDSDGNGTVDFGEYFSSETAGDVLRYKEMIANGEISKDDVIDMLSNVFLESKAVFQIIDEAMGDGSGELDETEFQAYYQNLDAFVDGSGETQKDGKFNLDTVTDFPAFLAGQIEFTDEDYATARAFVEKLFTEE